MAAFQVIDSTLEGTHNFGNDDMNQFVVTLKDLATGQVTENVNCWKSAQYPGPMAGETWEGEIENQARGGLKLTKSRKVEAGASGGASSAPAGASGGGNRERSIERQVALKAAAEFGSAVRAAGTAITAEQVVEIAEKFDGFLNSSPAQPAQQQAPAPNPNDDIPF